MSSKIDEIIKQIRVHSITSWENTLNVPLLVVEKYIEQLRPYIMTDKDKLLIELGKSIIELWKYDKIFFNDRKDLQSIGKLIQQIRDVGDDKN